METTRRLNNRGIIIFLISLAILIGCVAGLNQFQIRRNAQVFRLRAELAQKQGTLDVAIRNYRVYLIYKPDDVDARIAMGKCLENSGPRGRRAWTRIYANYEEALRRDPDRHEVRRHQVDLAMGMSRPADALVHIDYLLGGPMENDPLLERMKGDCLVARNDLAQAERYYARSIRHAPREVGSYILLANLHVRLRRHADAEKVMMDLVERNKENYKAHLAHAEFLEFRGRPDAAAAEIALAMKLGPNEPEVLLAAATTALKKNLMDEARKHLEKGIKLHPRETKFYRQLAQMENRLKRPRQAAAILSSGLAAVAEIDKIEMLRDLAVLQIHSMEDLDAARQTVEEMRTRGAPWELMEEVSARLHYARHEWKEAIAVLRGIVNLVPNRPELTAQLQYLLGQCHEKRGESDRALEAYRQALAKQADYAVARLAAARTLARMGRLTEAQTEFQLVQAREPEALVELARIELARVLRREERTRNWDVVNGLLGQAEKRSPGSSQVAVLRAQILQSQGAGAQSKSARALLEQKCREQPKQVEYWLALAALVERGDKPAEVLTILDQAEKKLGPTVELTLARAHYWLQREARGSKEAAAELTKLEQAAAKFTGAARAAYLQGIGSLSYRLGRLKEARTYWLELAKADPQELPARLALIDLALGQSNPADLETLIDELKTVEGTEGTIWRYAEAGSFILAAAQAKADARTAALASARRILNEILTRRPSWGAALLRLADVEFAEGKRDEALRRYEQAIDLGERNLFAMRRAISVLTERGQYQQVQRILEKTRDWGELPDDLLKVQSWVLSKRGEHEHAERIAQRAIQAGSQDPRDYVWLGQILAQAGPSRLQEAERTLTKATELPGAEKMVLPWVVLVQFLSARYRGETDRIEKVVQEVERKVAPDLVLLAKAQCYEITGNLFKAEQLYVKYAESRPDDLAVVRRVAGFFSDHQLLTKAQPYVRRLLDPKNKAPAQDVQWARRAMALWLASLGDYQQFETGRQLLEQNSLEGDVSLDNRLTKSLILATRSYTRRLALDILEELRGQQLTTLDDQVRIAELYDAVGDWPRARSLFQIAVAANNDNPAYLASYSRRLLAHDATAEAQVWLDQLGRLAPSSPVTLELRAILYGKLGRTQDAMNLVKQYLATSGSDPGRGAALYEELGNLSMAEEMFRGLAQKGLRPEDLVDLATFLARQGRHDEALATLEPLWSRGNPELAAAASLVVLRAGRSMPQHAQKVGQNLDRATGKNPQLIGLQLYQGILAEFQGKTSEAEAIYLRILQSARDNPVALGNLAYLYAFQTDKLPLALEMIERAIGVAGPLAAMRDTRGLIYLKMGRNSQAIQDFEAALREAPQPAIYLHLTQAYLQANDRNAALSSFNTGRNNFKLRRENLHVMERPSYDQVASAIGQR